ncbi:UDP-glucose 4-epimerase GalE [Marivita geojedonensis]|uniref:UDP-glucose 4-epimerase n=1 Tax=Marivita geojedonensis TaxID=1123756 RepID=A0A1X4NQS0_9RHOB|nr:UDP-glucose 4-epimerase GalE [Marivita geojedonensis]OSQ53293.1 UDP-glucose 4-epimerase [Marivita geojedonensis]PRY81747.1 UDP-galactose 4-epimerase [Marivita geojedonensis]
MNILVTGGAGYIGSHACKALAKAGFTPITFDNLSTGWRDAVKFGPFVEGDLTDRASIDRAFEAHDPKAILHFAALSRVDEAMSNPGLYWRNNVLGSLNLIEAATDHNCLDFVFSSTCATYGDQDNVVLDETTAQMPLNAYGASKQAVERILHDFGVTHGLRRVIFRYFNVAGADPEAEVGEFHRPETHLIPIVLDAVAGVRDGVTIYGTDYPTKDGTCIRDYVHVSDLVDAHVLGLRWLLDGKGSRVFNLGTGSGFSVREVIDSARRVTNRDVPTTIGDRRAGDAIKLVSGSKRAEDELQWQPQKSTMPQMIEDAWRWHQVADYRE